MDPDALNIIEVHILHNVGSTEKYDPASSIGGVLDILNITVLNVEVPCNLDCVINQFPGTVDREIFHDYTCSRGDVHERFRWNVSAIGSIRGRCQESVCFVCTKQCDALVDGPCGGTFNIGSRAYVNRPAVRRGVNSAFYRRCRGSPWRKVAVYGYKVIVGDPGNQSAGKYVDLVEDAVFDLAICCRIKGYSGGGIDVHGRLVYNIKALSITKSCIRERDAT